MTTIHVIPNRVSSVYTFICDSQETINLALAEVQALCSIGTEVEAASQLAANQSSWITQQKDLFTVNLQTQVPDGVVWTLVNIETEEPNTTNTYFLLDPTTGESTEAIGLTAAQNLLLQIQQTYLTFTGMAAYTSMDAWKPVQLSKVAPTVPTPK